MKKGRRKGNSSNGIFILRPFHPSDPVKRLKILKTGRLSAVLLRGNSTILTGTGTQDRFRSCGLC
jgi:hypothetical protein